MRVETIGLATLYCGDCREALHAIGGGIESIVSDPPYGMAFQSNHRIEKHSSIANDDCAEHLVWACDLPATHSKYIFCRWDNLREVPKPKSLVTWVKNNWSMGDLKHEHARQTEVALFYPGPNHFFPTGRPTDVVDARRTGNGNHPTEKPISLMMTVVGWTSGTVFDPFMGSGTTGVACARMGRPFIGVEIDEEYFEIACDRIAKAHSQADLFVSPGARPKFEQVPLFANDNTTAKAA